MLDSASSLISEAAIHESIQSFEKHEQQLDLPEWLRSTAQAHSEAPLGPKQLTFALGVLSTKSSSISALFKLSLIHI